MLAYRLTRTHAFFESMQTDLHPSSAPLRVAILGAGKMGDHHARALARVAPLAEVVAVFDPIRASADAFARRYPGARAYDDVEGLFALERIDVAHVCAPPSAHEALALRALDAGCHIYVEKPFAETREAAARVLDRARARGRSVCAGHQLLFEAPAQQLFTLVPALDDIVHIESYFAFRPVRRSPGGRTPLRADLQLLDILPHPVYLLLRALEAASPEGPTTLAAVQIGRGGSVHALVRRGSVLGTLTVTLEGRPVESYLRFVGSNGTAQADFVRGTVQRLIGPGISGIDKVLNPLRLGRQLLIGTTSAIARRVARRQLSYPGLAEVFRAFYESVRAEAPSPVSPDNILDTVTICEEIGQSLRTATQTDARSVRDPNAPSVLVTGGTGFLGQAVVESLVGAGCRVRVAARRQPAPWQRLASVEYVVADLGGEPVDALTRGMDVVVHCAAETAGGWAEHERNSVNATTALLRAAGADGVRRFVHVSSLAVVGTDARGVMDESTPLEPSPKARGPYVWGKLESERQALALGRELGVEVKIVRPGAIIDGRHFAPPGRLGKRLGNLFVAVGARSDRLGTVDLAFAGRMLAWMALNFESTPPVVHLLSPDQPTKRELVARLRASNPDVTVVWLPTVVLTPLSWAAIALQKLLRPRRQAVNVARVFAAQRCATDRIAALAARVDAPRMDAGPLVQVTAPANEGARKAYEPAGGELTAAL